MPKPKAPWLQRHTATLMRMAPFAYDHEIAAITGHCVDTVQRRRSALGIPPYRGTATRYAALDDLPLATLTAIRHACAKAA